eukprot:1479230-Ditylum_brightwellii.AAC.1
MAHGCYKNFLVKMNALTDEMFINLADVFFNNLCNDIRNVVEAQGFVVPTKPTGEMLDQAYKRVALVQEVALKLECGAKA